MKILVLQIRRIGDVLMTTPLVRTIAAAWPASIVHACLDPSCVPVLRGNPYVTDTIITHRGASVFLLPRLRRERYDIVIDTLGTPASARLCLLSGAAVRVGFDRRWRAGCYTHAVPPVHVQRYSALDKLRLLEPLGIHADDCRLELFPGDEDRGEAAAAWAALPLPDRARVVAFSPVSRRPGKIWPPERFAAVCDWLAEDPALRLLPLCAPGEEEMVEAVRNRMTRSGALLCPGPRVSFGALAPLMGRCQFYFGNDNGLRHVAVAAGIPTAAVFGLADPASWTPPGSEIHATAGGGRQIDEVSVDEVKEAVTHAASIRPSRLSPAGLS